jgi:hypothetical protein
VNVWQHNPIELLLDVHTWLFLLNTQQIFIFFLSTKQQPIAKNVTPNQCPHASEFAMG